MACSIYILTARGLILKKGTIVDSTFIEAPSSTKNQKKGRDPEAHSAKKENTWHFGYKSHIGVDDKSGIVHTVKVTAANAHDVCVMSDLLTGEEERIYRDSGYLGAQKRPEALKKNKAGKRIRYKINRRPSQTKNNSARSKAQIKRREHEKSSVRACCCEAAAAIPKDAISRPVKTDHQNEYVVCIGKSYSG